MGTVRITSAEELAQEAERAGLLLPERIEALMHEQLKTLRVDELFVAMERMQGVEEPAAMSPVAIKIAAMRAEGRGDNGGQSGKMIVLPKQLARNRRLK